MDRNVQLALKMMKNTVALRKESVDRNIVLTKQLNRPPPSLSARRAWIEIAGQPAHGLPSMSLSARRAWIEIISGLYKGANMAVALRKESVDRNSWAARARVAQYWSLSARRAWIEIWHIHGFLRGLPSRSPQGERG